MGFRWLQPSDLTSIEIQYLADRRPAAIAVGFGVFFVAIGLLYWLKPLSILWLSRQFEKIGALVAWTEFGKGVLEATGKLLILPWAATWPRVLDAWVAGEGVKLTRAWSRSVGGAEKLEYCPLPVSVAGTNERIPLPSAASFAPHFACEKTVLQLVGAGGAGKTSLAIQVVRWGIEGRWAGHPMLPLWIDDDLKDPAKSLIDRIRTFAEDPDLPESFIRSLHRRKRVLVVVDRLSERTRDTQEAWAQSLPEFVGAMIATTRTPVGFQTAGSERVDLEPLGAANLTSFIEHLLRSADSAKRLERIADRGELLTRFAQAITVGREETPVTPLLTKLFVDAFMSKLGNASEILDWTAFPRRSRRYTLTTSRV